MILGEISNQEAIANLNSLRKYNGWKFFKKIINEVYASQIRKTLSEGEYDTIEERNRDKDQLNNFMQVMNMPENIIRELSDWPDKKEYDPYAKTREEIENPPKQEEPGPLTPLE